MMSCNVVVVVECIYEPCVQDSVALSSAECSRCLPPSSLVCGQLLTVWHHLAFATRARQLLQGLTSFDRMHSGLPWSGSNLEVPSIV